MSVFQQRKTSILSITVLVFS